MTKTKDDRSFIQNPNRWPQWPFLPIKRRDKTLANKNLGILCDTEDSKIIVYHVNLFDLPKVSLSDPSIPKTNYDSIDALLIDDWEVD